jgi:phage shock protein PspC (stress-responsive transcriptional regulator)
MKEKMYRPTVDRVFGGVCSGVAYYMNIDPIFIRILFAVLLFYPFPIVITYLLLWMFTPSGE